MSREQAMDRNHYQRVIWREGMLISPQHLQQQELYEAQLVHERLAATSAPSWGVLAVELAADALASGRVELVRLDAVLPDGTLVRGRPVAPSRIVGERFPSTADRLAVHVGLPVLREGVANFQAPGSEGRGRYVTSTRKVGDIVTSSNAREIELGEPAPVLLFGDEGSDEYVKLTIAEVVRDEDGSLCLSRSHIPPVLQIGASPVLMAKLRELLGLAVVKQRSLTSARRQRDAASIEFAAADVTRYLLLNALNGNIPRLKHISEEPRTSPLAAYLALLDFAGGLSSFAGEVDPSSFPRFSFLDLRGCFDPLLAQCKAMLGAAVKDMSVGIPLEPREDGMWIGRLSDPRMIDCRDWVLAVESDSPEQEVANKLPMLSKISSWTAIAGIVKSATPGVPLVPTHRPPTEIAIRPRQVYFMVDKGDRYWRDVLAERTVAIYVPPPYDPKRARLSLLGIPRAEG